MKRTLLALAALAAFAFTVVAQTTGSMSGTITDSNGAVVPGASVTVTNIATGAERKTTTSESGTFSVPNLQPGNYSVAVESSGFKRSLAPQVVVGVSTVAQVAMTLEVVRKPSRGSKPRRGARSSRYGLR